MNTGEANSDSNEAIKPFSDTNKDPVKQSVTVMKTNFNNKLQ